MPDQNELDPYAPTTWGEDPTFPFKTPSGQLCLLRRLQPVDLLGSSLLGNVDMLGKLVGDKINEAQPKPGAHAKEEVQNRFKMAKEITEANGIELMISLMQGSEGNAEFASVIDNVVRLAVVKPVIHPNPKKGENRVKGMVYVDTVKFLDKVEIFRKVMEEMRLTQQFPDVIDGDLEAVATVKDVPLPAESDSSA